jgi:hypothetical protein
MPRALPNFSSQELAQLLKIRKHTKGPTLFLGARTGGLFRSPALYNNLQKFSLRDFSLLDDFGRFAECFRQLSRSEDFSETDIHGFLKTALRDISATYTDIFVADLLKQGIFDVIITTCIDDVLEQALNYIGQREAYDFSVHIPRPAQTFQDQGMQLEPRNNGPVAIWKLFGDLTSLSYNINKRISQVHDHQDLQKLLTETRTRDLLMVGFDPVWDGDILAALFPRSASNSLWYVNEQPPEEEPVLMRFLQNCHAKYISGAEGNHKNFFQELHLQMMGKFPAPYHIEPDFLLELRQMKNELEMLRREFQHIISLFQGKSDRPDSLEKQ